MKTYPRTDLHTWVWPRNQLCRFTSGSSPVPVVCAYTVNESSSPLTFDDQVSYGENFANWKQRLAEHLPTTTSLIGAKAIVRMTQGSFHWYWNGSTTYCLNGAGHGNLTGYKLSLFDPGSGPDSVADAKAKAKLLDSYLNAVNTWRGGNFLAEIRETMNQVLHPVKSFYDATYSFAGTVKGLRKYKKNPTKYGKALANAWLAYVFGVKPFISDANDASNALEQLRNGGKADIYAKLRGSASNNKVISTTLTNVTPVGGWAGPIWSSLITKKRYSKVRYVGALKTGFEDGYFQAAQFGVSLEDFAPAVWEAIPWSFLVDYFVNVQQMLDGQRLVNATPYRLDLCVRNAGVVQVGVPTSGPETPAGYVNSLTDGPAHSLVVRVSRAPQAEFPWVGFRFKFPGFPSLKWLNIAALLEQIRSSKP